MNLRTSVLFASVNTPPKKKFFVAFLLSNIFYATMKPEGIFITDKKLSQITPNLLKYPVKASDDEENDKQLRIHRLLSDLTQISIHSAQQTGYFILSSGDTSSRWRKPAFFAVIQVLCLSITGVYLYTYTSKIAKSFGVDVSKHSTLGVSELILTVTMILSDMVGAILFLKEREDLQSFMTTVEETLITFAEQVQDTSWIPSWFRKTSNYTKLLVMVIDVTVIPVTVILCHKELYRIYGAVREACVDTLDYFTWTFPIFALSWFAVLFRRLHFRILIMSTIDCLQFGFRCIKHHVRTLVREEASEISELYRETKLNQILDKYRTMEMLLYKFNDLFAPHLLIGIVSIVVVLLMALFHFFVELNYDGSVRVTIFGTEAAVYMLVLFSLGSAATKMACQVNNYFFN